MFAPIIPAKLEFLEDGTPFSGQFGDVYFSREGGHDETRHVFLNGNNLPESWRERKHFTIAETGFGTGLNFLVTRQAWRESRREDQWLYYISIEKHPLPPQDIQRLHPELAPLYPPLIPGFHWRVMEEERMTLLLIFADVETALPELDAVVNAWFLDGFAPAKNEAMWSAGVFHQIARLSAPDATAATYTVARKVRDGLSSAGFDLRKTKGYGTKRDMLVAARGGNPIADKRPEKVTVIGAGLAGCSAASALSRHGIPVTLHERHPTPAQEASGNPAAILMPYVAKLWAPQTLLLMDAFLFTAQLIQQGFSEWEKTGVLQLASRKHPPEWQAQSLTQLATPESFAWLADSDEASAFAGIALKSGGIWLPDGLWLNPAAFCNWRLEKYARNITRIFSEPVDALPTDGSPAILTNALDAMRLAPELPLHPVRGQLSYIPGANRDRALQAVLSYDGYAVPQGDDLLLGATFDSRVIHDAERAEDHVQNIIRFRQVSDAFHFPDTMRGRVSYRTATPDRLPMAGEVRPGLWSMVGLGSRGAALSPLLAEALAARLMGTPNPLPLSVQAIINPDRYVTKTASPPPSPRRR